MSSPSVAAQSVERLGGPRGVLVRQPGDHAELDTLLHGAAATSGAEQDEVLSRLARLSLPHGYAEETVLWPTVRSTLPDGEQITRVEHAPPLRRGEDPSTSSDRPVRR